MEGTWGIGDAEAEHPVLVQAAVCEKGCFLNVLLCDQNLIETRLEVHRSEDRSTVQAVEQVINSRERVSVFDCEEVECPVVNTHADGAVLLGGKYNGGPKRGLTRLNPPFGEQFLDLLLNLVSFPRAEAVHALVRGL